MRTYLRQRLRSYRRSKNGTSSAAVPHIRELSLARTLWSFRVIRCAFIHFFALFKLRSKEKKPTGGIRTTRLGCKASVRTFLSSVDGQCHVPSMSLIYTSIAITTTFRRVLRYQRIKPGRQKGRKDGPARRRYYAFLMQIKDGKPVVTVSHLRSRRSTSAVEMKKT